MVNTDHKPTTNQQLDIDTRNGLLGLRADLLESSVIQLARKHPEYSDDLKTIVLQRFSGSQQVKLLNILDGCVIEHIAPNWLANVAPKPVIKCGISQAFHNKTNISGNAKAFGNSFTPTETDLPVLVQHITNGGAWTPGYFAGISRTKATFIQGEFLALDFDENTSVQDLLGIAFFKQYACLLDPTASHTPEYAKTRAVFHLDRSITNVEEFESLQTGFIALFSHLSPDEKCKDAARLYFGSDVQGAHINLDAVLSVDTLKALIADHLSKTTSLLNPTELKTIRVDSEVGRLSIALKFSAHLRAWAIARAVKDGKWELGAFWQEIAKHGIKYTDRHQRRILADGEGVFWNHDRNTNSLYLIRPADELTRRAMLLDPELVESNLPGLKRDAYIPITANLEQWNALLYAGWYAAKKQSDITRALLCQLFNTSKRTLIRWEKRYLGNLIKVTPNIVQTNQTPEECNAPAHHYTYTVIVARAGQLGAKTETRTAWQLPNTYTSKIKVHKRNGQRKRILSISKMAAGIQPLNEKGEGLPRNPRQIFVNSDKALKAVTVSNEPVKVVIGHTKTGIRKSELTLTCIPTTSPLERIKPASRNRWYEVAKHA